MSCPVCYNELTLKNMMNLRCSHQLCKDCYYNWVDSSGKNTCPCCRDEIMKSENYMKEEKLAAKAYCDRMEFAGYEARRSMTMWTEYGGANAGNHRPVLQEGELDEL